MKKVKLVVDNEVVGTATLDGNILRDVQTSREVFVEGGPAVSYAPIGCECGLYQGCDVCGKFKKRPKTGS